MKNKSILIIALLVLIVSGAVAFKYATRGPSEDQIETQVKEQNFCTQDVRECSDGTYVHRVAPSCNFQKCTVKTTPPQPTPIFEDGTVPQNEKISSTSTTTAH